MKTVIAGYYGFGNIGDELILSVVLDRLRKKYPSGFLTVLSANPRQTSQLHHVDSVNRWRPFSVLRRLWLADLFVLGGGGLLQDDTSALSLFYYLFLMMTAQIFNCSVFLYAIGVEHLSNPLGRWALKKLLQSRGVTITVRDEESKLILAGLGVQADRIHVTGDPVFSRGVIPSSFSRYSERTATVLFVPRFPCPPQGQKLYEIILSRLKADPQLRIMSALFQRGFEKELYEKSSVGLSVSEENFLPEYTAEKFMEEISRFDFVVSARFHGLVMAALAGRPFLGMGDPAKVGRFCRAWNRPFLPWDSTPSQVEDALSKLLSPQPDLIPERLEEWRRAADRTIEFV